jgi:hypothetical protein
MARTAEDDETQEHVSKKKTKKDKGPNASAMKGSSFMEYNLVVSEADREANAAILKHPLHTLEELGAAGQKIAREVLRGKLPPDIARSAYEGLKMSYATMASKHRQDQLTQQGGEGIVVALFASKGPARQIEAYYTDGPEEFKPTEVIDVAVEDVG